MSVDGGRASWTSLDLLERYRDGDDQAATAIFARYFDRLTALARSRLSSRLAGRTDPEDIALSAYRSFFVAAREGRYTLSQGGDLWRLLAAVAKHKLLRQVRYHRAGRRSIDVEIPLDRVDEGRLLGRDPTPEDAAALADELERLLSRLDPSGRRVLELRLQGLPLAEIAADIGRSERSVRRVLAQIHVLIAEFLRKDRAIEEDWDELRPAPRSADRDRDRAETDRAVSADQGPLLSDRDFLLRRLIGSGGMGKVYEATRHADGRSVAVKYLRKSLLHRPEAVRRFLGEARTISGLRHPNIVGTQGLGRTPGGSYFLVMELVNGTDLAHRVGRRIVAVEEAIRWTMETCEAIEHAHGRGVIHCDLKPANLLLDEGGTIRVTDFGLARWLAEAIPGAAEIEGTAPFMAPEQVARCWGPIDERTDVYGIGAVLFTLLTGRPPIVGRRVADILAEVVSGTPVASPTSLRAGLPESLIDLCQRCLTKAPAGRFANVREVRLALEAVGTGGP